MLSRDVFVEELIQALHAAGETRTIRYEAEIFSVLIGDNRQFPDVVVRLDEEFRHCEKLPPDRRANEIHRFAEICRQPKIPDDYQEAQAHLRLSLRHISFVQLHAELAATWPSSMAPTSPVYAKVTDELILCVGLIKGPVARILTGEQAARWNVSADQLVQNAARNHFKSEFRLRQTGSVYRSPGGDTDLAAVLVSGHLLSKLPLRGSPVILVPARDCLVATGSEEIEGLIQMVAIGHVQVEESQFPVSGRPLRWDGHGWHPFEPPEKLRATFVHLEKAYEVVRYTEQSSVLDMRYRNAGDGTRIAPIRLIPDETGFKKVALWNSGSPVLLPAVDVVVLHNLESGVIKMARWSDVQRVLGERLAPMHTPLRYRAERFPTPAEIEAMKPRVVEQPRLQPGLHPQGSRPGPMGFMKR